MNYATIKKYDIANGPGVRTSLFVSGCIHRCKNCFNQETWDPKYGSKFTEKEENEVIESLSPSYISGLTVLGGDPFCYDNAFHVAKLLRKVKREYPNKSIWVYTGYTLNGLMHVIENSKIRCGISYEYEMLKYTDVLVDGPFIEEQKNLRLKFRGSINQRLIDVQKTIFDKDNKYMNVVLYNE